jgi:hypothetical protein
MGIVRNSKLIKSLVFQGQQLGAVERSISFVAVAASIVPGGSNGAKIGLRALHKLIVGAGKRGKGLASGAIPGIIGTSERVVDIAGALGIKGKESTQGFVNTFKKVVGNNLGEIEIWARKFTVPKV